MLHGTKTVIKHKIGLLNLAEELGNVSKACRIMGLSRDTFYRYQNAVEQGGVEALIDRSRRKPNLKNRVDEQTEAAVVAYAIEQAAHGQVRASNELRKRGVFISPSGVRCVWMRNNLACFKERLKALEEKSAKENFILTESQVQALERKKHDDVIAGEIETAHPGYLGSQDTGKTAQNIMYALHSMMDYALRDERISLIPPFPKEEDYNIIESIPEWLNTKEFWEVLNKIPYEHKPIFLWMYYHLMREAEACAIQWEDWDDINQVFWVRRSISARKVVESTKTGKIYPTPCHRDFYPYMLELKKSNGGLKSKYIFTNRRARKPSKRYTNESINNIWKRACKEVGKSIRPYAGTRHSRQVKCTMNWVCHFLKFRKQEVGNALNR